MQILESHHNCSAHIRFIFYILLQVSVLLSLPGVTAVNFGLETKKSIIHPRSDSSNRSTRFSLSSEKSCPDGPHMIHDHTSHVGTCQHAQDTLINDDIEKRVLVNKDGSLSVEMKVRFRLLNDETLQWSTEIKKSVGAVNDSAFGNEKSHYLQPGKSESCSDLESSVQCEPEEQYVSECDQRHLDESQQCQNGCNHCKEYNIWKNPMHGDQGSMRHFRSSSSSASSYKIVCKKESVESMPTISRSSEEYAEHVIQKATQQTVAGDTKVEYCAISHSCSCNEVCAKSDSRGSMDEKCKSPENDETRSNSLASVGIRSSQKERVKMAQISKDRPVSGMSSNSKILEELKGYQDLEDTDDDELPPSISKASLWPHGDNPEGRGKMGSVASNSSITAHKSVYSMNHLPPKCPNKAPFCCTQSAKSRHCSTSVSPTIELLVNQAENENIEGVCSAMSADSKRSSKHRKSHNSGIVSAVPGSVKVAIAETDSRKAGTRLKCSNASRLSKKSYNITSLKTDIPESLITDIGPHGYDGHERTISISRRSRKSNSYPQCDGSERSALKVSENLFDMNVEDHSSRSISSVSDRTNISEMSMKSENYKNITPIFNISENVTNSQLRKDEEVILKRQETSVSAETNDSEKMNSFIKSEIVHGAEQQEIVETEEIALHTTSAKISFSTQFRTSKIPNCNASIKSSQKSNTSECPVKEKQGREDEDTEKCAVSTTSVKPDESSKSRQSNKFQHRASETAESVAADDLCNQEAEAEQEERMDMARSVLSASENASNRLGKSNTSDSNATDRSLKRVERGEKVSRETSYRRMKLERSEISVNHHSLPALNDSEGRAISTVSAGTKIPWKSNSSDTNPCGACDGGSSPMTPLPKISGNCENDSELESETRVRSSVDSKASGTKKSSICQSNDMENSGTSLAVEIPKNNTDQSEERVESVVSLRSQASATSTKSNSITNSPPTPPKSVALGTANGNGLEQNEESAEERLKSAASFKSNVSERSEMSGESGHCSSKSISTPTKTLLSDEQEVTSVGSVCRKTPTKCKPSSHLNINDDRVPSAFSSGSARNKSSSGDFQLRRGDSTVSDAEKQDVSESGTVIKKGMAIMRDADKELTSICGHESAHSGKKSPRKDTEISKTSRTNSAAMSIVSWNCLSPSPSKGASEKYKNHGLQNGNSHDGNLSCSLSAADLLKYRSEDVRPDTAESKTNIIEKTYNCVLEVTESYKNVNDNKNDKGGRCRHGKRSSSSLPKKEADVLGIVPYCLPNTSPREVVHDWLKKIPTDSPIYDAGEEFYGQAYETNIQKNPAEKEEESAQKELMAFDDGPVVAEEEDKEEYDGKEADDENQPFEESTRTRLPNVDEKPPSKCGNREALPKSCQSSVQVMKILLNPKFDRCNSLPEVSPVYGRKLSNSAKGLLDCLAKLQLIDIDPADVTARDARYNELMNILQSLWLCDPLDDDKSVPFKNHRSADDPKSSSGVDVSSGSAGSGKGSDNGGLYQAQKTEFPLNMGMALVDQNPLQPLEEDIEFTASSSRLILDGEETATLPDRATPDIAMRVRDSPVSEEEGTDTKRQEEKHKCPDSNETIRSDENPKEIIETPSTSNRSSGNEGDMLKLAGETVRDIKDVASCRILPYSENIQNKKVSKDPDPVWVLNLLKKLEKQFMTHYVNAMAEFKVRWDLDDNVILDAMINELREEVSKRIQSSISRELQKIHSRAGREPRPPMRSISRESSAQTEQRRRRLKVMHNKSIKDSLQGSEENYTVTGTDFSDQRSEDGYCPCETCMKKKMASRLLEQKKNVSSAPVMMDFDLRKILQLKRDPPAILKEQPNEVGIIGGNGNQDTNENLKVLQEEEGNREQAKLKELQRTEMDNEAGEGMESISREQITGNQSEEKEGGTAEDDAGEAGKDSGGIDVAENEESGQVYGETEAGDGEPMIDGIAEENAAEDSEETEEGVTIKEEDKAEGSANQDAKTEENIASAEVTEGLADADKGKADKYDANEEYGRAVAETTEDYPGEGNRTHEDDDSHCVRTSEEHSADKVENAEGKNPETSEDRDAVKEDGCDQLKEFSVQIKAEVNTAIERQETENIDVTVRVHVAETRSTEGNVEEQQHDSDIAEDNSETCVVARFTVEEYQKNDPGETELENVPESGCLIKQITKSSIESQPGSIEAALDEDRNIKFAESSDDSGASKESQDSSSSKQ